MNSQQTYYEYWSLTKPPFDNVPDPEMYFDMHSSVDHALHETLFAIEEGNECLAVIVGDVGLGKTMTLRVILDSLQQEKYQIAFITNPDMTFIQLVKEIISQLTGEQCTENRREQILEMFNQVLFKAREHGKKVLIFIDEANAIKPANLESLRLLTNLQSDEENLLTIIMAGQLELAQRLEHPKRANLFQRIGVYCRLNKIESRDLMRDYIEHRLERSGTTQRIFTDAAYDAVWEYSEHGVPRLINRVAKLALSAAQTQGVRLIDDTIVHQIGARFARMSKAIVQERRERMRDAMPAMREPATISDAAEEDVPAVAAVATSPPMSEESASRVAEEVEAIEDSEEPSAQVTEEEEVPAVAAVAAPPSTSEERPSGVAEEIEGGEEAAAPATASTDAAPKPTEVVDVIKLPEQVYTKAEKLPMDQRVKFAGQLAAEVLKRYPHLVQQLATQKGSENDPVAAWSTLRTIVIRQMEQHLPNKRVEAVQSR